MTTRPAHVPLSFAHAAVGGCRAAACLPVMMFALAVCAPVLPAAPAAPAKTDDVAKSADPVQMLRAAVDEVLAIAYAGQPSADALAPRLRTVLEKYFNFDFLTRSAVGPAWSGFSPEQQKRTTTLFTEVVIRTYAQKFEPGDRPKISYAKPVERNATSRELPTTITYAGKTYAVSYSVRQFPEGWRIYDVNIEGVSMVSNYRAQFDPIAQKKDGPAALIAALEKNIADFKADKK
ncbi:MAG: ABC transporter substrate-binding protein [Verrucomicrobiota bacterium]